MPDIHHAPPLRDAATLILIRENNASPEIYLLRRNTKSRFMGGLYVFPGGVVDPEDRGAKAWAPYVDMNGDQIEAHLGGKGFSMENALVFSIAAIRETLEEAGVFLAVPSDQTRERLKDICTFRLNKNLPCSWFKTRVMDEHWTPVPVCPWPVVPLDHSPINEKKI